jgi:hypothetical protein
MRTPGRETALMMSTEPKKRLKVFEPLERLRPDGFLFRRWHGLIFPPFIDPEIAERMRTSWDTDEDDIFISTHQKVGTHLTKKFVVEILRHLSAYPEGSGIREGDIGHHTVPWPEVLASQHGLEAFHQFLEQTKGRPRVWYMHSPAELLPFRSIHPKSKFIFVLRDPRSVVVSQYYFYRSHPLLGVPNHLKMEDFLPMFLEGGLYFGDYHHHTLEWMNGCRGRIAKEQLLVLRYEDLVERKEACVERLSTHIMPGRSLTASQRKFIADSTDFETMKQGIIEKPGSFHFNPQTFFRAGQTEGWREHLDEEQRERIDEKSERIWGAGRLTHPDTSGVQTLTSLF